MKKKSARLRVSKKSKSSKKNRFNWSLSFGNLVAVFSLIAVITSFFLVKFVFAKSADIVLSTPKNSSPTNNAALDTYNFQYSWTAVSSSFPVTYFFEISNHPDTNLSGEFKEPINGLSPSLRNLSTNSVDNMIDLDGVYYWHVKALSNDVVPSLWSNTTKVSLSTRPPKPVNFAPNNNSVLNFNTCNDFYNLKFSWQDLTSLNTPVSYTLEFSMYPDIYDPATSRDCQPGESPAITGCYLPGTPKPAVGSFKNVSITMSGLENHIINSPLQLGGDYYWHVRTVYKDLTRSHNSSEWSDAYKLTINPGFDPQSCFVTPTPTLPI